MIPFASQRGGGQDLATHLLNDYDNDLVEIDQVKGAVARDLHGAFKEWEVQAHVLTKCEKYLYSLSINPDKRQGVLTKDQYMDYIRRTEDALGLSGQPRAVVFHIKHGREHCHVVWSRIDAEKQKAVHIAFDRDKLMHVTRGFARDHGLRLPAGYEKSRKVGQETYYERAQQRQTGFSKADHKREVTDAWHRRDTPKAFVQSLAERGYILATGNRDYVLVDLYGGMNALPKLIDDKDVKTKQVREFLGREFPKESLPSVDEARNLIAAHRKLVEKARSDDRIADRIIQLKHSQTERRKGLEQQRDVLKQTQQRLRKEQQAVHHAVRGELRSRHMAATKVIRRDRYRNHPTGLAAFLGKVTGVALIQKKLHRYRDARRIDDYLENRKQLQSRQAEERKALDLRLKLQASEVSRKIKALESVDKREMAALERDIKKEQRMRARDDGLMPSLAKVKGLQRGGKDYGPPSLLQAFEKAKQRNDGPPDLSAAFEKATLKRNAAEKDDGGSGIDKADPRIARADFNEKGSDRGRR